MRLPGPVQDALEFGVFAFCGIIGLLLGIATAIAIIVAVLWSFGVR